MNSLPPDDDQLDAFLRTPPAALPSPPPHVQRTSRLRVIFVGTGALAGLGSLLLDQHDWSAAAGSVAVAFHTEIRERLLD